MQFNLDTARRLLMRSALVVVVAGLAAGCGIFSPDEGSDGGGGGGGGPFPLATSPTLAIDNLARAYQERNYNEYDNLLHAGFIFYFAPQDIDLSPGGQGFIDRAADVGSTQRMFAGQPGRRIDPDTGQEVEVSAVQSIRITLTPKEPVWVDGAQDGAEFAGSLRRLYEVDMEVRYTSSEIVSEVKADQRFYVKPVMKDVEGVQTQVYQLFAWFDLALPISKVPPTS